MTTGGLVLTLRGVVVPMLGGWLGDSLAFVHATRVLAREPESTGDRARALPRMPDTTTEQERIA